MLTIRQAIFYNAVVGVLQLVAVSERGFPDGPNQQCSDDAGPPWEDDGNVAYYVGFPNTPVLQQPNLCPAPLSAACKLKGALAAHLDGPVDCAGKGWFCRIFYQPDHRMPGMSAGDFPDSNFASCNQSDTDHDRDGHCHGSDVDDTYGWWIRDHWHRNYAGSLKCCCDWKATIGVVNRCDYRKHVSPSVRLNCRDANEEHNVDWAPGCTQSHFRNYQEPPSEKCWQVSSFGPGPFDDPPLPSLAPPSPPSPPLPSSTPSLTSSPSTSAMSPSSTLSPNHGKSLPPSPSPPSPQLSPTSALKSSTSIAKGRHQAILSASLLYSYYVHFLYTC